MERRKFTAEFKRNAVELYRSRADEVTIAELARDLGIHKTYLWRWVKKAKSSEAAKVSPATKEQQEIKALKRRIKLLEEEREILKKASAFLAKERDTNR